EEARRYGFRGGLVPGVTVYGYACHALLDALGPGWVGRGVTHARFISPCYDGEDLVVSVDDGGFSVSTGERTCVVGSASISPDGRGALDVAPIPAAPVPEREDRPLASADVLAVGRVLGSVWPATDWAAAADYLELIGEPSPTYATDGI